MKRVIVIGCPGSGKTTFSEKLQKVINLPLYYLDAIWHLPDKTHIPRSVFDEKLNELLNEEEWIIDGNYQRTLETRLKYCDTVFLFDLPTEICLEGAISRLGKGRYDVPWIENELDSRFKKEIENFCQNQLPEIYSLLNQYTDKTIIIFKTRIEADDFINLYQK